MFILFFDLHTKANNKIDETIEEYEEKTETKLPEESEKPENNVREANNNDITLTMREYYSEENITYYVIPKKDIDGLIITLREYDEHNELTREIDYFLGNVKEDEVYTFKLSLAGYSAQDINNISSLVANVTGGTTSKVTTIPFN